MNSFLRATITGLLAAAFIAVAAPGCTRGKTGIDLPRYPGATYQPLDRREYPTYTLYSAVLQSPTDGKLIQKWYDEQLEGKPGWTSGGGADGWYQKNMEMGRKRPKPVDASQPGAYIEVSFEGTVTLFKSVPKDPE